jgi:hypothetical protein
MTNPDEMNNPQPPSVGKCRPGDDPRVPRFFQNHPRGSSQVGLSIAAIEMLDVFKNWLLASNSWDHRTSNSVIIEYAIWAAMGYPLSLFKPATPAPGKAPGMWAEQNRRPLAALEKAMKNQERQMARARDRMRYLVDSGQIYLPDPKNPNPLDAEPGKS